MKKIKLGDKVKDSITGYIGICVGITEFMNGCRRIGIQGKKLDQNNLPVDLYWIDETTVSVVAPKKIKRKQTTKGASNYKTPKFSY